MTHNTYTIEKNNINENTFFNDIFATTFGTIDDTYNHDYSEDLDDLILSSIADKNPGISEIITPKKNTNKIIAFFTGKKTAKKASKISTLMDAINYLSNYYEAKNGYSDDYIKIELPDGNKLYIYGDEIMINNHLLSLEDSAAIAKLLTPKKQKIIIDFAIKLAA